MTVVEWVASRGEYREWTALNGEYAISELGTVLLPLVGTIEVSAMDTATMATEVAKRIQKTTGLVAMPNVAVQIVEYPPVFLVGNVDRPGEYRFRPGLTVLQAVALAGGRYRPREEARTVEQIQYLGELQAVHGEMVRTLARIARLKAEVAGEKEIQFPDNLTEMADSASIDAIFAEERAVFAAQANGVDRQLENLEALRKLFADEIEVLQEKVTGQEKQIKLMDEELEAVKPLVERGIATTSRQSELQRIITALQSDRLDQVTAIMRARQNISQASRDFAKPHQPTSDNRLYRTSDGSGCAGPAEGEAGDCTTAACGSRVYHCRSEAGRKAGAGSCIYNCQKDGRSAR